MPLCIVTTELTMDPKGANNPDDYVQVQRGEVLKLMAGDNLIAAGRVVTIPDSDVGEIVTCKCGRMFSSADHPHFTQAGLNAELFNARDTLATLEEGTAGHTEQGELIEKIEKRIAAEQKKHKPVEAKAAVAA